MQKVNVYYFFVCVVNIPFYVLLYIYDCMSYSSRKPFKQKQCRKGRPRRRLVCKAVAVYATTINAQRLTPFDTDSALVDFDNRASACFSHVSTDFVGPLRDCNRIVKGFGGTTTSAIKIGTLKWSWLDDQGRQWTHLIPNSYYSQTCGVRLLSPQHFAQQTSDLLGTGTRTNGKEVQLYWDSYKATLTIPLSPRDNVATMHLAPGFTRFQESCYATKVSNDPPFPDKEILHSLDLSHKHVQDTVPWTRRTHTPFDTQASNITQYSTRHDTQSTTEDEYLTLHESMGHIHHDRLQLMARQGIIPKKFLKCMLPFCASCAYGKQIRTNWRSRSSNNKDESTSPMYMEMEARDTQYGV